MKKGVKIDVMDINIIGWVLPLFFALAWTYGQSKPQYTNKKNASIMVLWWLCIAAFFFLGLSPFHLYYVMPLVFGLTNFVAIGMPVTVFIAIIIFAIY